MIKPLKLQKNMMALVMQIQPDGQLRIMSQQNLDQKSLSEEDYELQLDFLQGLGVHVQTAAELIITTGHMSRLLEEEDEFDEDDELIFEPDEKLLELLAARKVLQFKKKLN